MQRVLVPLLIVLVSCGPAPEGSGTEAPAPRAGTEPPRELTEQAGNEFAEVRDAFLAWYHEAYPVRASELGIHDQDARLPALDRVGVQTRIDDLLDWIGDLEDIPFTLVTGPARFDYALMEFALRANLLELEEVRSWVNDPRIYTGTIAAGLAAVAGHAYAPAGERIAALGARMRGSPALLDAARENLRSPPELWTELAREDTRALIRYLEEELPAVLEAQGGDASELDGPRSELIAALEQHDAWLETELLPRSTGDFRLGRYLFQRKLLYEEHVSLDADELERLNEQAIGEYRQRLEEVAAAIDPDRTPEAILDSLGRDRPSAEDLLSAAQARMEWLRDRTREADVVTLPDDRMPRVREAPARVGDGFAVLDAPGPFESGALDAYLYLTTARPEWGEAEAEAYRLYLDEPTLAALVAHYAFPGRYVQAGFEREIESRIRRAFPAGSFVDGWAHYAEGMILEAGPDEAAPELRLGQIRRALQQHARWYAALHLHAFDTPVEEVVARFARIALLPESLARREVVRATYDPTYLRAALGRMQIAELREDYREYREEADETFTLREFHDRMLRLGLPIPLAREVMIPPPQPARRRAR